MNHNTSPLCSQELWPLDHRGGQGESPSFRPFGFYQKQVSLTFPLTSQHHLLFYSIFCFSLSVFKELTVFMFFLLCPSVRLFNLYLSSVVKTSAQNMIHNNAGGVPSMLCYETLNIHAYCISLPALSDKPCHSHFHPYITPWPFDFDHPPSEGGLIMEQVSIEL
jgi:hypothetical protein